MTNEMQTSNQTEENQALFGKRLKSKRESFGLDRKEAAGQLRLNEKMIIMMESDKYPADLPLTFIRGYLRSYAKLLQIPEFEVNQVLQQIKLRPESTHSGSTLKPLPQFTGNHYFMPFFTYLIMLTLCALVSTWWYRHSTSTPLADNRQIIQQISAVNSTETASAANIGKTALTKNKDVPLIQHQTPIAITKKETAELTEDNPDSAPVYSNETN